MKVSGVVENVGEIPITQRDFARVPINFSKQRRSIPTIHPVRENAPYSKRGVSCNQQWRKDQGQLRVESRRPDLED
jgi:hypothetical protein